MIVGRNGQKSNRHTDFSRQNWFSPIRVVNRELIPPYRVVFFALVENNYSNSAFVRVGPNNYS